MTLYTPDLASESAIEIALLCVCINSTGHRASSLSKAPLIEFDMGASLQGWIAYEFTQDKATLESLSIGTLLTLCRFAATFCSAMCIASFIAKNSATLS